MHKYHLRHTVHFGPTCQSGRSGGSLRGEHLTYDVSKFLTIEPEFQCQKCANSKLFAFLKRKAAEKVTP